MMERRRTREFVDAVLAEHEALRSSGADEIGACCVFADELIALRVENERFRRANEVLYEEIGVMQAQLDRKVQQ